jgi:hypothetical protein
MRACVLVSTTAIVIVLQSCALFATRFEVVSVSPQSSTLTSVADVEISVRFNRPADQVRVENAFSLTSDETRVDGRIEWPSDSELRFVPTAPLEEYRRYELIVGSDAEAVDGTNLTEEFVHQFSSKRDTVRPQLISLTPADGATLFDLRPEIVATFSEPLNRETALSGISVSPTVRVRTAFSPEEDIITLTPLEDLSWGQTYTVTIDSSVSDVERNTVGSQTDHSFTLGNDLDAPQLLSATALVGAIPLIADDPTDGVTTVTTGVDRSTSVQFLFDEPVAVDSLRASLSIQPNVAFEFTDPNDPFQESLTVSFSADLSFDQRYTLTLSGGISDRYDNRSAASTVFVFQTDALEGRPPEVISVHFQDDPAGTFVELLPFSTIPLANYSSAETAAFDVLIRAGAGASLSFFDFTDVFEFSVTGGAASFEIIALEIAPTVSPTPVVSPGPDETIVRVLAIVEDLGPAGTVRFTVSEQLVDSSGNAMEQPFELLLNKE